MLNDILSKGQKIKGGGGPRRKAPPFPPWPFCVLDARIFRVLHVGFPEGCLKSARLVFSECQAFPNAFCVSGKPPGHPRRGIRRRPEKWHGFPQESSTSELSGPRSAPLWLRKVATAEWLRRSASSSGVCPHLLRVGVGVGVGGSVGL